MTRSPVLRRPAAAAVVATLALVAALLAVLPAAPARAAHTPLPATVTLVGSLQSEIGCAEDWQESCCSRRPRGRC